MSLLCDNQLQGYAILAKNQSNNSIFVPFKNNNKILAQEQGIKKETKLPNFKELKIKYSDVCNIISYLDFIIEGKVKQDDELIGIMCKGLIFIPVNIWDNLNVMPMKGLDLPRAKQKKDIPEIELYYDVYKTWQTVSDHYNDIKNNTINIFDKKYNSFTLMMINEIYKKNIYNVVLNNVINYMNDNNKDLDTAITYHLQNHEKFVHDNFNYNISSSDSVFYKENKIRVDSAQLELILKYVRYDIESTPQLLYNTQKYAIPCLYQTQETNVIIKSKIVRNN